MKYEVKVKNIVEKPKNMVKLFGNVCAILPIAPVIKIVTPIVNAITHNKFLGVRVPIFCPLLFKNVFSGVKVTLLNLRKIIAIIIRLGIAPTVKDPTIIPAANMRFQKLSLFILVWMKPSLGAFGLSYIPPYSLGTGVREASLGSLVIPFSFKFLKSSIRAPQYCWFKLYNIIIPKYWCVCKVIATKWLIMTLLISGFSSSVAFGADGNVKLAQQLKEYIAYVERVNNIPSGLLLAIASVESGLKPFVLNIEGRTVLPRSYREAMMVAQKALALGVTNIDLGVMQVNYRWHAQQFEDLKEMLHPKSNIKYAGKLLAGLYKQHGDWHKAVRYYNSATPEYHRKYSRKIVQQWLKYI